MKIDFKKISPHVIAILAMLIFTVAYFYPQIEGKVIQQSDLVEYRGMSAELRDYQEKTGKTSWWTDAMFGGMPAYQISSQQTGNLLPKAMRILRLYIDRPIGLFFGGMVLLYIAVMLLGFSSFTAVLGAIGSIFAVQYLVLYEVGHVTKIGTLTTLLPLFIGLYLVFKEQLWRGGVLFGVASAMALYSNHPQMLYYFLFPAGLYIAMQFYFAIKSKSLPMFWKQTAVLLLMSLLALGSSAAKLWTTYEYSKDTMRGEQILESKSEAQASSNSSMVNGLSWEYAMQWSNGVPDVIATVIPGFAGGSSAELAPKSSSIYQQYKKANPRAAKNLKLPLYWGPLPFTAGTSYFGIVLWLLFIYALLRLDKSMSIWLGVSLGLLILLSMGKNFEFLSRLFFDYIPMYNKFRAPNSITNVAQLVLALGAMFGLHSMYKKFDQEDWKKFLYASGGLAAFVLFFALFGSGMFDFESAGDARYEAQGISQASLIEDRIAYMRSDAFRTLLFLALAVGLGFAYQSKKIKWMPLALGLIALVAIDSWTIGKRYLNASSFQKKRQLEALFNPTKADNDILKLEPKGRGHYRVLDLSVNTFNSSRASLFHNSIGGYHAAKLQRFEDVKRAYLEKNKTTVYDMFNVKYVIQNAEAYQQLPTALGPGWFVQKVNWVETNNQEFDALNALDPRTAAVVQTQFKDRIPESNVASQGQVSMTSYEPNEITYEVNSDQGGLVVFSEVWYGPNKGWQAYLDGNPVDHARANYILRALHVPTGKHTVRFSFEPKAISIGNTISFVCSAILILFILWGIIGDPRRFLKTAQ